MKYERQNWNKYNEARVAAIARSISQDVGRNFKYNTLRKLFPKKMIKDEETGEEVDIGIKCCEWLYKLIVEFSPNKKQQYALIYVILKSYEKGYDFEKNKSFLKYFSFYIVPTFSKKINNFSQISKLSFMDDLDRKTKSSKSRKGDDIQW